MEELKDIATTEAKESPSIFEEYARKFTEAVEHEKQRAKQRVEQESGDIIASAEKKASAIIAEAEQHAKSIAEKTVSQAKKESAAIVAQSKELTEQIIGEVERFTSVMTQAKLQVKQEAEKAREGLQKDIAAVKEAANKAQTAITEVSRTVGAGIEESLRIVTEMKQTFLGSAGTAQQSCDTKSQSQDRQGPPVVPTTGDSVESVEQTEAVADDPAPSAVSKDETFVGTFELEITPPGPSAPFERLERAFSSIPGAQVLMGGSAYKEKNRLTVFFAKPVPLFGILKQRSLVESIVRNKKDIKVILNTSDIWRA
ncbi:hypothetical protein ACFLS8_01060 [Chloroflexota bacterium]